MPRELDSGAVVVEIDVALVSPNRLLAEHWRSRHHRRARERAEVRKALSGKRVPTGPWTVEIVRIGSRKVDDDNGVMSAKAVRDEVASWLGVDDRDPRVAWRFEQEVRREPARGRMTRHGRAPPTSTWRVWCRVEIRGGAAW